MITQERLKELYDKNIDFYFVQPDYDEYSLQGWDIMTIDSENKKYFGLTKAPQSWCYCKGAYK